MSTDLISPLIAARQSQGLSVRHLARLIGASPSSVHNWEHGIKTPSLTHFLAWAKALNFKVLLDASQITLCSQRLSEAADSEEVGTR